MIEMVDTADKIDQILEVADEMVQEGMVTVERVQILKHHADHGSEE